MKRSGILATVAALVAGSVTLALNRTPKTTAAEITLAEGPSTQPPPSAPAGPPAHGAPISLVAPVLPPTAPKQMQVDVPAIQAKYPNLLKIQHFSTVDLVIIGSKARLGLKDTELQDFATYCVGQLFKGYDLKPLPEGLPTAKANEYGTLNVIVNTYPMGVSVELRMGTVGSANTWTTNELRVSTNNAVKDGRLLKTSIATMIAKAAYTLRKTQGR